MSPKLNIDITNTPIVLTHNGQEIRINCPKCDDTKFHCYVNLNKQVFICHKCGSSGKLNLNKEPDLINWNKETFKNLITPTGRIDTTKPNIIKTLPICGSAIAEDDSMGGGPIRYLKSRGVTFEQEKRYDIRISREKSGPYKNTVIFPVYSNNWDGSDSIAYIEKERNKLQFFVCRRYTNEEPKYLNAPWPKEDSMFITKTPIIGKGVIVEGVMDALALERAGFIGIALLGKRANSKQLLRLNDYPGDIGFLIYLDRDAFSQSIELKLQLSAMGIKSEIVQHTLDAADLAQEDMNALRSLINESSRKLEKS